MSDLPHSIEAERAVLGAPLVMPSLLPELVGGLDSGEFFIPAHREIFEAFSALAARDKPADVLLVADELQTRGTIGKLEGGIAYLTGLATGTPTLENFAHYLGIVRARATQRRLIGAATEIKASAQGWEWYEVETLLAESAEKVTAIALRGRVSLAPIAADVEAALAEIEARQALGGRIVGVSTGIDALDRSLNGLRRENVYVVAARPGLGKTALAMGIARRHAQSSGSAVLVFSLEMPRSQLVERLICAAGDVDSSALLSGQLSKSTWTHNIHPAARDLHDLPIVVIDDQYTIGEVEATAHRWRAMNPEAEGLIVVDYLQLFEVKREKGETLSEAVGGVSNRVKRLAKKLKVPIVLLSQLNRDSEKENRPPRMSDLRASGEIEQDADAVIFIHDRGVKEEGSDEVKRTTDGPVELRLEKNRHGATGLARARWVARFYSFTDLPPRPAPADTTDEDERRHP